MLFAYEQLSMHTLLNTHMPNIGRISNTLFFSENSTFKVSEHMSIWPISGKLLELCDIRRSCQCRNFEHTYARYWWNIKKIGVRDIYKSLKPQYLFLPDFGEISTGGIS